MVSHAYITTSGTWQAPSLVSGIILIGAGGGGGGGCADDDFFAGGGGGGGSLQQVAFVEVSALTTYTITIGAGGAGGFPSIDQLTYCGSDGYSTTFANGGILYTALGAGGAGTNSGAGGEFNHGGLPWSGPIGNYILQNTDASPIIIGAGGAWAATNVAFTGMRNYDGKFPGGAPNVDEFTYGAGGGGAGPQGSGGDGGSFDFPNGVDADDNSGAGGGGGNIGATMGGHGGSGYLHIMW